MARQKCPSELNTRQMRVSLGDFAFLNDISQREGVSLAGALSMTIQGLETKPGAPGSKLQIPLLPVTKLETTNGTDRLNGRIEQLEDRKTFLESPGHQQEIIQKFLRDLDSDNFYTIGLKLGLLEYTEPGPGDKAGDKGNKQLGIPLGDKQFLRVTKEKPEDMSGWEYSKNMGVYIKVEDQAQTYECEDCGTAITEGQECCTGCGEKLKWGS